MSTDTLELVSANEIQQITAPVELVAGISPESLGVPRPDLAGARLMPLVGPAIYLVNPEGYLQWIPNPATYNNLFRDWNGVQRTDIAGISAGPALSDGALLAKGSLSAAVYIISNGLKRWITSPDVMNKYYFSWNRVIVVPQILIDEIPVGNPWS